MIKGHTELSLTKIWTSGLFKRSAVWGGACQVRIWRWRTDNCWIFYPAICKIGKAIAVLYPFSKIFRCYKNWRAGDGYTLALSSFVRAGVVWLYPTGNKKRVKICAKWKLYGWIFSQLNNKFFPLYLLR